MPFHCVSSSGKKLYSFTYDATAWAELKEQSKSLSLKMSCCDTPAVLKTSRLGTQFFAHKSKASSCEHSSKGETVEHQFCKFLVSRQLYQMGWHVETEKVGYTPEGKMWIADIYAERKKAKIAIEIQWSPQDYEETVRRQQAYKSSGLDCIWFLNTRRNYDYSQSAKYKKRTRELPVFPFTKECDGAFYVHSIFSAKHLQKNYSIAYSMELVDFVSELFSGNIQFRKKETPEHSHKINLVMRNTECFNCEKELILPFELQHYAKYRDQWYKKNTPIESINQLEIDTINNLFSDKWGFTPLSSYIHQSRGFEVYATCIHCRRYILLSSLTRMNNEHKRHVS